MRSAMDSAPKLAPTQGVRLLVLALVAGLMQSGCSGQGALRQRRDALTGLWSRPVKSADPNGYDLYAESVASARKQLGKDVLVVGEPVESGRKQVASPRTLSDPTENEQQGDLADEPKPAVPPVAKPGRSRKANDTEIRVTLGRPENLPSNSNGTATPSPMLVAGSSTAWRRPGEVRLPQEISEPAPAPGREQPRPRRQTLAPSASAPPDRPAASREEQLVEILTRAKQRLETLLTYQVNIARIERVGGQLQPEEEVLLSIRRSPKAVRLEWEKGPSKGREVIYSAAINDRMMYVNVANSALPIPRISIPVDSPLVLRNSRHAITEAGFDTIFNNLFTHLNPEAEKVRESGKLTYKGLERPKGYDQDCHLLERVTAKGEMWRVYLDVRTMMPATVIAYHPNGELTERYTYRNLKENPEQLTLVQAFDPDKRWGESKGFFSRLARAANSPPNGGPDQPATR